MLQQQLPTENTLEEDIELKADKKKSTMEDYVNTVKYYYLPILILAIFFLILFIGVLPSLSTLFNNLGELDSIQNTVEQRDQKIKDLKVLEANSSQNQTYLDQIKRIAPVEKTNVVAFQTAIRNIAKSNRLTVEDSTAGEARVSNSTDTEKKGLELIEVPTEFNLTGKFEDIKNFLSAIYEQSDFIVIHEMEFTKDVDTDNWRIQVILVKYQFAEPTGDSAQFVFSQYSSISEKITPNKKVLDFLDFKYLEDEDIENDGN